jgi:hypothetical protein
MKLLRIFALLIPAALATPLSAQAAMDPATKATFIKECAATAGQKLDAKSAKTHCECGADQVNKNFNDSEIAQLKNTSAAPNPELTARLQKVVSENCVQTKK